MTTTPTASPELPDLDRLLDEFADEARANASGQANHLDDVRKVIHAAFARRAKPEGEAPQAEAFAWAVLAENGNVIIWSKNRGQVEPVSKQYGRPVVPVIALSGPAGDEAVELLAAVFDAWENGIDCYEDPESNAGYLGMAFKLDDDVFQRCVDLLNRENPPRNAALAAQSQGAQADSGSCTACNGERGRRENCTSCDETGRRWAQLDNEELEAALAAKAEVPALTPLDYRAQGREEALAVILGQSSEDPFSDCIGWSKSGAPEDEGGTYWKEDELRKLLHIGDARHDAFGRAEAAYWEAMGRSDEAKREMLLVEQAPFYKPLSEFLSKHHAWDLMADLKRAQQAAAPGSAYLAAELDPAEPVYKVSDFAPSAPSAPGTPALAEACALLRTARDDCGLGSELGGKVDAFLERAPGTPEAPAVIKTVELADCPNCGSQITVPIDFVVDASHPALRKGDAA
jgi:hypothetical protein